MSSSSSVETPSTGRFYQHGWHSWSVTGWRPRSGPVRYPVVPAHRLQATDPAHLDDPLPGGSGVGAVETDPGHVTLLGALDVDGWVTAGPHRMVGVGASTWHQATGPESQVFADYAAALASALGTRRGDPGPVWCSWYSYSTAITEAELMKVLSDLGDLPFGVFQIDDGWQRANGDWTPNNDFPSGMEAMADHVIASGRVPGLWLAPFLVDAAGETAGRYPDMLLRDASGQPVTGGHNWGPATFVLDVTRTDVLERVTTDIRRAVDWGYRYLKLDFLYAAALPSAPADKTPRERTYRRAIEAIREAAGDDVYLLACGAPILPSIGVFDAIRVGPDVAPYWDNVDRTVHLADRSGPGAADAIVTSLSRYWLRSLIDIDPDVAFFRSRNCLLSPTQRSRLIDLAHVCGFRATSDPPEWLDGAERTELERFLTQRPTVEQLDRYRFLLDGRDVDFTDIAEARPW